MLLVLYWVNSTFYNHKSYKTVKHVNTCINTYHMCIALKYNKFKKFKPAVIWGTFIIVE